MTAGPSGERSNQIALVAAPREVRRPHLAGAEAEAGCARDDEERVVVTASAVTGLARPGALPGAMALRLPLVRPEPGEVEELGGAVGNREHDGEGVDGERSVDRGVVAHSVPDAEHALGGELERRDDRHRDTLVGRVRVSEVSWPAGRSAAARAGSRIGPARPVHAETRAAAPTVERGGQQAEARRHVDGAGAGSPASARRRGR